MRRSDRLQPQNDAQVVKDAHATSRRAEKAYKAAVSESERFYDSTSSTDYGKAWDKTSISLDGPCITASTNSYCSEKPHHAASLT